MTTEKKVEALREIVEYVYRVHEWCEQPRYRCSKGGHSHSHYCADRDDGVLCEGCQMALKAEESLR